MAANTFRDVCLTLLILACVAGCADQVTPPPSLVDDGCGADEGRCPTLTHLFATGLFDSCTFASPQAYEGAAGLEIVVLGGGRIVALDPQTGDERWRFDVPVPTGSYATLVATPAITGSLLVAEYHTILQDASSRQQHFVIVVDLDTHELADGFEPVEVEAMFPANDGEMVPFRSQNAFGRAQIVHATPPGSTLGRVYVTYGNVRDIQPWHGFAFELDLDDWRAQGPQAAISGGLVTTPESDCGPAGASGSTVRICGGGLWSPSGPLLMEEEDSYSLVLPTGNGQLDLNRNDFANTLMRVEPGLDFDPKCDEVACADFDSDAPSTACVESCANLFVPHDSVGDPFPVPEHGRCDGKTMFECWAGLDYIGGSTPVRVELASGTRVLAYPTKDGSVYLLDADHLGTLYDREQIVEICGTLTDTCRKHWAGMIVTQPAVPTLTERPTILVPTFMPDETHPAGVVALAIDESSGTPKFERLWSVPDFDTPAAISRFREHPSRIGLQRVDDQLEIAWIVEAVHSGAAQLLGIDVTTGNVIAETTTGRGGMRFTKPLIVDDVIYVNHCAGDNEDGSIEAFRIEFATAR